MKYLPIITGKTLTDVSTADIEYSTSTELGGKNITSYPIDYSCFSANLATAIDILIFNDDNAGTAADGIKSSTDTGLTYSVLDQWFRYNEIENIKEYLEIDDEDIHTKYDLSGYTSDMFDYNYSDIPGAATHYFTIFLPQKIGECGIEIKDRNNSILTMTPLNGEAKIGDFYVYYYPDTESSLQPFSDKSESTWRITKKD